MLNPCVCVCMRQLGGYGQLSVGALIPACFCINSFYDDCLEERNPFAINKDGRLDIFNRPRGLQKL